MNSARAYHEAGHAVVAFFTGLRIRRATIRGTGEAAACVETVLSMRRDRPDVAVTDLVAAKIEREVMVCVAGRLAQQLYAKRTVRSWQSQHDYEIAIGLLMRSNGDAEVVGAHLRYLEAKVRAALATTRHRVAMEAVAAAVDEYEEMTGGEVVAVIQSALQRAVTLR